MGRLKAHKAVKSVRVATTTAVTAVPEMTSVDLFETLLSGCVKDYEIEEGDAIECVLILEGTQREECVLVKLQLWHFADVQPTSKTSQESIWINPRARTMLG